MSEFERMSLHLFQEMVTDLKKVVTLLEGRNPSELDDPRNWATTEETLKLLTVSIRTLYTMRVNEEVLSRKKGKRFYYFKPDIFRIRNFHIK